MQSTKVKTKQQNKNINVMESKPTNQQTPLEQNKKRKEGLESYDKTLAT
jgi:hypothetical protein